jgi:hypothetical protein
VAGTDRWKHPPTGVPSQPDRARPYVSLSRAAQRLGVDRRTLLRALVRGDIPGWARPGPDNLRWYVYDDGLTGDQLPSSAPHSENPEKNGTSDRIAQLEAENAQLRARLMSASESNLLLMAAHEDLTASAGFISAAADKYRQALSLYMTPDHIADLAEGAVGDGNRFR